jgi:acyl-CoA synthetase (AMP-forming)/AMP-acid ligase II
VSIVDRLNDMIISGDENSESPEVAKTVSKHHAVRDCAQATSEEIVRHYHRLMATDKCRAASDLPRLEVAS